MDKERFKLCVRTYYPFAEFYDYGKDEIEVAQKLPKDYWAEPDEQWLGYSHFMHGLSWAKGDLVVDYDKVEGSPKHQEQVLLDYLKQLSSVGVRGYIIHNVPPLSAIFPPKPKEPLFKRLFEWVKKELKP